MNITKEELKDILLKHEQWFKKEKGGECADLSGLDLSGVDIPKANLAGANLAGADLTRANLSEDNLAGANRSRAILSNADFVGLSLMLPYFVRLFHAGLPEGHFHF
jgi:uncharacterized protein YjbI with pentapeptide repeats